MVRAGVGLVVVLARNRPISRMFLRVYRFDLTGEDDESRRQNPGSTFPVRSRKSGTVPSPSCNTAEQGHFVTIPELVLHPNRTQGEPVGTFDPGGPCNPCGPRAPVGPGAPGDPG